MKRKLKIDKSLVSYFFMALTGVLTQLIVSSISQKMLGLAYTKSIALGYFVAFVTTFFLINRYSFTTDNNGKIRNRIIKYILVSFISGLITVYGSGFSLSALQYVFDRETIMLPVMGKEVDTFKLCGHFIGMGASFVFNYVCHRTFTFRKTDLLSRIFSKTGE